MAEPIAGPDLLKLRATILRVEQYGGVRGDKPLILRQAAALLAELDRLYDFRDAVLAAAEQWKERGYLYEACGMAVDDLMNGGDGYV